MILEKGKNYNNYCLFFQRCEEPCTGCERFLKNYTEGKGYRVKKFRASTLNSNSFGWVVLIDDSGSYDEISAKHLCEAKYLGLKKYRVSKVKGK